MWWLLTTIVVPVGGVTYAVVSMLPTRRGVVAYSSRVDDWGLYVAVLPTGVVAVVANYGVNQYGRPAWLLIGVVALLVLAWVPLWILGGDKGGNGEARANSGRKGGREDA